MKKYTTTIDDLAEIFNVSRKTIFNWLQSRELPHVQIGSAIRFNQEDVQAWAERQTDDSKKRKRA